MQIGTIIEFDKYTDLREKACLLIECSKHHWEQLPIPMRQRILDLAAVIITDKKK